ncbi:MAG: hypothetical protein KA736_06375 [Crocinitomicaceae bacterium]|nr:hypothetical protein [Crocinitomicaceae bacterium]MBP6032975.1 hypothetical protein [Crocinitomicaceae bacterium]
MKITLFLLVIFLTGISCQTNPCKMTAEEFSVKGSYLGKVHLSKKEACPVYITIEGVFSKSTIVDFHTIYPINLESAFKKDGIYIRFNYTTSRAMSPEGCVTDGVVSLENVEKSNEKEGTKFQ